MLTLFMSQNDEVISCMTSDDFHTLWSELAEISRTLQSYGYIVTKEEKYYVFVGPKCYHDETITKIWIDLTN